jgi:hypothetical protein
VTRDVASRDMAIGYQRQVRAGCLKQIVYMVVWKIIFYTIVIYRVETDAWASAVDA